MLGWSLLCSIDRIPHRIVQELAGGPPTGRHRPPSTDLVSDEQLHNHNPSYQLQHSLLRCEHITVYPAGD